MNKLVEKLKNIRDALKKSLEGENADSPELQEIIKYNNLGQWELTKKEQPGNLPEDKPYIHNENDSRESQLMRDKSKKKLAEKACDEE